MVESRWPHVPGSTKSFLFLDVPDGTRRDVLSIPTSPVYCRPSPSTPPRGRAVPFSIPPMKLYDYDRLLCSYTAVSTVAEENGAGEGDRGEEGGGKAGERARRTDARWLLVSLFQNYSWTASVEFV